MKRFKADEQTGNSVGFVRGRGKVIALRYGDGTEQAFDDMGERSLFYFTVGEGKVVDGIRKKRF